jgi:hypothetical protein
MRLLITRIRVARAGSPTLQQQDPGTALAAGVEMSIVA